MLSVKLEMTRGPAQEGLLNERKAGAEAQRNRGK